MRTANTLIRLDGIIKFNVSTFIDTCSLVLKKRLVMFIVLYVCTRNFI